jgi:MscS family membrane protein
VDEAASNTSASTPASLTRNSAFDVFVAIRRRLIVSAWVASLVLAAITARAQPAPGAAPAQPAAPASAEGSNDPLGRSTPRGAVLGFLVAARRGENDVARQYLNTRLTGQPADELTHELLVVLDARLPARLEQLSDAPEGSRSGAAPPGQEIVGTVVSADGNVEIVVERLPRGDAGPVWMFSSRTLEAIPAVYEEVVFERSRSVLPRVLLTARVGGIRLVEWLAILLGLAVLYLATVLLNRVLTPLVHRVWRRAFKGSHRAARNVLPVPARLLILALLTRWLLAGLPFSLLMRQFWSSAATLLIIASIAWLLVLLGGVVERYIRDTIPGANTAAVGSLVHVARRAVDLLVIFAALLVTLRHFGIDPTPALAGLGVGGIAVALAAQKTLENVIAGASLIFDKAVTVGDFLRMGDTIGTVDHIGLRSTRIRTLGRTLVSVPNSQIANTSLETLSARDMHWFHPTVGLRYRTTSAQLRAVVDGIRRLLSEHPSIDRESVRVRFSRIGAFSLDVEVFAYVNTGDWLTFLEIREQLLFGVTEIVETAGTAIAFPSQTMYIENMRTARATAASLSNRQPLTDDQTSALHKHKSRGSDGDQQDG